MNALNVEGTIRQLPFCLLTNLISVKSVKHIYTNINIRLEKIVHCLEGAEDLAIEDALLDELIDYYQK